MEPFRIARNVYSGLYSHGRPEADQLAVACQVAEFRPKYKNMSHGVDYSQAHARHAYTFSYMGGHASFLAEVLALVQQKFGPLFGGSNVSVACVGGGPGTDMIGVAKFLSIYQQHTKITGLQGLVLDKEIGWQPIWAAVASELGIAPSFLPIDATQTMSPQIFAELGKHDLITISYIVSEIIEFPGTQSFVQKIFEAAKPGSLIAFIDNSGKHTGFFDTYCKNVKADLLLSNIRDLGVEVWAPTSVLEQARSILGQEKSRLVEAANRGGLTQTYPTEGYNPKSSGKLGFRIFRKL